MPYVLPVILLLVGVALGVAGMWFLCRARLEHAADKARGEVVSEVATLNERAASLDRLIADQKEFNARLQEEKARLHEDLKRSDAARAAAEERARQAAALEAALKDKETSLAQLSLELTTLKAERSQLVTELANERSRLKENLDLLEQAKRQLTDTFKALASEALNSNNQSFLDLAKTKLEKFREEAKTDLETRQQAIGEMVKPVKESLEKIDVKIQELEVKREGAYEALKGQVASLLDGQRQLSTETSKLANALR